MKLPDKNFPNCPSFAYAGYQFWVGAAYALNSFDVKEDDQGLKLHCLRNYGKRARENFKRMQGEG